MAVGSWDQVARWELPCRHRSSARRCALSSHRRTNAICWRSNVGRILGCHPGHRQDLHTRQSPGRYWLPRGQTHPREDCHHRVTEDGSRQRGLGNSHTQDARTPANNGTHAHAIGVHDAGYAHSLASSVIAGTGCDKGLLLRASMHAVGAGSAPASSCPYGCLLRGGS